MTGSCKRHYALTSGPEADAEAWVEDVRSQGDCVVVALSLADGSPARSILAREWADWLDLRPGQIIGLAARSPRDPGLPVVGEHVDLIGEPVACDIGEADRLQDAAHVRAQCDPDSL